MRFHRRPAEPLPGEWQLPDKPAPASLDTAREIALREIARGWQPGDGELMLDPDGASENDEVYTFNYGAREYFVDHDMNKARVGYRLPIVRKRDGAFTWYLPGPPPLSDFNERFPDLRAVRAHSDGPDQPSTG